MSSDEGDAVVKSSVEIAAAYSGSLPPPEWLRQYEQVLPGTVSPWSRERPDLIVGATASPAVATT